VKPATPLDLADLLASRVRSIRDYPEPGVVFRDITPLLADPVAFAGAVDAIVAHYKQLLGESPGTSTVDKVVGIEARGFIVAAPVAYRFGAGFVPVRKAGKLPAATYQESYTLEYGTAVVEVHRDAFTPGERVLIVDDVLATGGTAAATAAVVRRAGAEVVGISVLIELTFLGGRARLEGGAAGEHTHVQALLAF
jgi:adenine phosphoribosyltransferase